MQTAKCLGLLCTPGWLLSDWVGLGFAWRGPLALKWSVWKAVRVWPDLHGSDRPSHWELTCQDGRPVSLFTQRRSIWGDAEALDVGVQRAALINVGYFFDILSCSLTHSLKHTSLAFLFFYCSFFLLDKCLLST